MENDALAGGRAAQAAGKLSRLLSRAPLLSLMSFLSNESDSLVPGTCHSYTHVTVGFGDIQAFSWTALTPKHHTPEGNIQRPHTGDFSSTQTPSSSSSEDGMCQTNCPVALGRMQRTTTQ